MFSCRGVSFELVSNNATAGPGLCSTQENVKRDNSFVDAVTTLSVDVRYQRLNEAPTNSECMCSCWIG